MNDAQRIMLFRLFGNLANARTWGVAERDLQREKITAELFGAPRSWSTFNNSDVDRMKARLTALANPDSIDAQIADGRAAHEGERKRLLHRIEEDMRRGGFNDSYVMTLCRDLYDTHRWRELDLPRLENLRDTLANRARRKRASLAKSAAGSTADSNPF